jgi:nitrite reductase (NO-forming)
MNMPGNRNDRVMLTTVSALVGLGLAVGLSNVTLNAPAAADIGAATTKAEVFRTQPARGPVPHAHTFTKHAKADGATSIVRDPTDLPRPIGNRGPQRVKVDLETTEIVGQLADGATYRYWTFNNKVPGPFVRVRVGDTVEVRLKNHDDSVMMHNVDFHAVTGPGGGAKATDAGAGEVRGFEFTATNPGLYVYHCAVPMAAQHIANGMYGLILVEPVGGLPKVDHEFYVMQGDFYTRGAHGEAGMQPFDLQKAIDERPEYVVFNGSVGSLTGDHALKVKTGETVRLFVGNGGPNLTSSFHVIGEVFDNVYAEGSTVAQHNVQTTSIPAGGSAIVEFRTETPGKLVLVDHALFRAFSKGAVGLMQVEGEPLHGAFSGRISEGPYTPK